MRALASHCEPDLTLNHRLVKCYSKVYIHVVHTHLIPTETPATKKKMNNSVILQLIIAVLAITFCVLVLWAKAKNTQVEKPTEETSRDKGKLVLGNKDYTM